MKFRVSFGFLFYLVFHLPENFKQHCLSVSSGHVKVWNRSAVFMMLHSS